MTHRASSGSRFLRMTSAVTLTALLPVLALAQAGAEQRLAHYSGVIIRVHGEITPTTAESLRRRIDDARVFAPEALIFELNTQGGRLDSAIEICDLIKNQADIKTVAWVNTTAHSAGALIAVACDEIVMARSSRIGDSQAILGGPLGVMAIPEELQPKMLTPLLHEFEASAKLHGYCPVLSEAFVRPELEVWWMENIATGERKFVSRERAPKQEKQEEGEEGKDKDDEEVEEEVKEQPPLGPPEEAGWKLAETYYDEVLGAETKVSQPIVRNDRLLQMSAGEAIAFGFCKAVIADESKLTAHYGLASVVRVEPSWSETLAGWLTSVWVRGFLLVLVLLGAYVEFNTPGVGVPGLVALICLAVFVGAPYVTGLANVWEILVIVLGVVLLAVELFVIPGFGVAGIAGIVLVLIGVLATFVPDEPGRSFPLYIPQLDSTIDGLKTAMMTLATSTIVAIAGIVMLGRYVPRMPLLDGLMPANPTPGEVAMDDPYRGHARVGDTGRAEGPLRPAGKAKFGSMLVDVVTEGDFIEAGTQLEVIERRGNHVVVRAVT